MGRIALWLVVAAALGLTAFLLFGLLGEGGGDPADLPADGVGLREGDGEDAHLRGSGQPGDLVRGESSRFEIVGRVLDAGDEPIAGCSVGLRRPDEHRRDPRDPSTWTRPGSRSWGRYRGIGFDGVDRPLERRFRPDRTTETDDDGRFRVTVEASGSYDVRALVDAPLVGSTARAWVSADRPSTSVHLRVLEGTRLQGRVIDAAERAVAAVVWGRVRVEREGSWAIDPVETDPADGTFTDPALPAGEATFTVVLPGRLILTGYAVTLPHEGVWTIRLGERSGAVSGRIQDATGAAVADAWVLIGVGEGDALAVGRAASGEDGAYRVDGLPAGVVTSVVVERDGFGSYTETPPLARWSGAKVEPGVATTIDVTLLAGATVEGVVRERGTNRPLADVEVFLLPRAGRTGEPVVPNTRTDASGRYALSGAAPGAHVLVARSATHYLPQMNAPQPRSYTLDEFGMPVTPPPPPELMLVIAKTDTSVRRDLVLAKGLGLGGRVVGPEGEAVGGAEVVTREFGLGQVAWRWGVTWPGWNEPLAVTGTDGRFAVHNLPPMDALTLSASKRPLTAVEAVTVRVAPDAPPEDVVIRLAPGVAVEGRVLDPDGNGVTAWINAWGTSVTRSHAYASTEPDGSFRLEDLPAGGVRLMVSSTGYAAVNTTLEEIPAGETKTGVEIRMRSGVRVSGVLVDQRGHPVPKRGLTLGRPNGGSEVDLHTDESGYFETDHAPTGRLQAYVRFLDGNSGAPRDVGEPFESPIEGLRLTVVLPERTVVEGTVVDPDGTPVPLCRVLISPVVDGRVVGRRRNDFAYTDPTEVVNGEFRREVQGEPPFEICVATPRSRTGEPLNLAEATVRVADPAAGPVVIRLEPGLEVRGRVVDAEGNGIPDVIVQLGTIMGSSDAEGAFRVGGLTGEQVRLRISPPPGWVAPAERQVQVGDEEVEIVLAPAAAVGGTVLDAKGRPQSGFVRIEAGWESSGSVKGGTLYGSAQNGTFRIDGIPRGVTVHLVATVFGEQGATAPMSVDVEAGTLDVEIRLAGGPGLAGVVVDESGTPVPAVSLSIERADGTSPSIWTRTTEEGKFEAAGLEAGNWLVRVTRPGERSPAEVVRLVAPTEEARIVLGKERSIRGRLVAEGALSNHRVRAWADGLPGTQVGRDASVKADGTFEVKGLGRGRVVLVTPRRGDDYAQSTPLEPGATGVQLALQKGERIAGRVIETDGDSKPRRPVQAVSDTWKATTWSNEEGAFELRGLPPGTYRLRVQARGGDGTGPEVQVATGATDVRLRGP